MGAGQAGDGDHARSAQLRQEAVGLGAQFARLVALVVDQVPFVERDDQRPALLLDEIGERQVLLFERDRSVEHEHDDFRETHRAQRVGDGELLDLLDDARAPAQARRVEDFQLAPAPFGVEPDEVARDAGLGAGRGDPAEDAVDERRFSRVRAPEDGDAQRLRNVELAAVLLLAEDERLGLVRLLGIEARGGRQDCRSARHRARRGPRHARRRTRSDRRGRG